MPHPLLDQGPCHPPLPPPLSFNPFPCPSRQKAWVERVACGKDRRPSKGARVWRRFFTQAHWGMVI